MQNQVSGNIGKVGELSLETAKRLGGWNVRLWDRLTEQQLAGVALWVDAGIKQLRLLGESHNPYDIYAGQTQLAQEYGERVSEYVRQTMAIMADVQNNLGAVFKPPLTEPTLGAVASSAPPVDTPRSVDNARTVDGPRQ